MVWDERHVWIVRRISASLQPKGSGDSTAEDFMLQEAVLNMVNAWLGPQAKHSCICFYEGEDAEDGQGVHTGNMNSHVIVCKSGSGLHISFSPNTDFGKCLYFLKRNQSKPVTNASDMINDILVGELSQSPLQGVELSIAELFLPSMHRRSGAAWGQCGSDQRKDLLGGMERYRKSAAEALRSTDVSVELRRPDTRIIPDLSTTTARMAAMDGERVRHFEMLLCDWMEQTEKLSRRPHVGLKFDGEGPLGLLDKWRSRSARLQAASDQLLSEDVEVVLEVLHAAHCKLLKRWKSCVAVLADAVAEAKDVVKFVAVLERHLEPLYSSTPPQICAGLPSMMQAVITVRSLAKHFSGADAMTELFVKISNQMIDNCRKYLSPPGTQFWEQDQRMLNKRLRECVNLNDEYQREYKAAKTKAAEAAAAGARVMTFELDEAQIFGRMELFSQRLASLEGIVTTFYQFQSALKAKVPGLDVVLSPVLEAVKGLKSKVPDVLDYTDVSVESGISEVDQVVLACEKGLLSFLSTTLSDAVGAEGSLRLLARLKPILVRDNLRADVDSKYTLIFHRFGKDIKAVAQMYEKFKSSPPFPRTVPPVAGSVIWARQLLRRIEEPMSQFNDHRAILNSPQSRKIIRQYNKVGKALIEFEELWRNAWIKAAEVSRKGLLATVLVKHPTNGEILVNLDPEAIRLIREGRCLQRLGWDLPESATLVLKQENRFKTLADRLAGLLSSVKDVQGLVPRAAGSMLQPAMRMLEDLLIPGLCTLTWTSLSVDNWVHQVETTAARTKDILEKIDQILDHRVEANLRAIRRTLLVDIPETQSFLPEQFVNTQDSLCKVRGRWMNRKNEAIENAVEEVISLSRQLTEELHGENSQSEVEKMCGEEFAAFKAMYSRLLYGAVLQSVRNSFKALKGRIRPSGGAGLFSEKPVFVVDCEFALPHVSISPSLDDIQAAINQCATSMLRASKRISAWSEYGCEKSGDNLYTQIGQDVEVVKLILLLTGCFEGMRNHVNEYLSSLDHLATPWKDDPSQTVNTFASGDPTYVEYELVLSQFNDIQSEADSLSSSHIIGPLALSLSPLVQSIQSASRLWLSHYGRVALHSARDLLEGLENLLKSSFNDLERKIDGLEDVTVAMRRLALVTALESDWDGKVSPCERMYTILGEFGTEVSKEEVDQVRALRKEWQRLLKLSSGVSDDLRKRQRTFRSTLRENTQSFIQDVKSFRRDFENQGPSQPNLHPHTALERIHKFQRLYDEREGRYLLFKDSEELFGLTSTSYPELDVTRQELKLYDQLYTLFSSVVNSVSELRNTVWSDAGSMIEGCTQSFNEYDSKTKRLPKVIKGWEQYTDMKKQIDSTLECLQLIEALSTGCMEDRHWEEVSELLGTKIEPDKTAGYTVGAFLDCNPLAHRDDVEDVATAAVKEKQLLDKLKQLMEDWELASFTFANFKNRGPVLLKGAETQDLMEKVEESLMQLGAMSTSRYVNFMREEVSNWVSRLSAISEILEQWIIVQSMWVYLEAVFCSGDIAKQLPQEAKRFQQIDKNYMKIMAKAYDVQRVLEYCWGNDVLRQALPHLTEQLELCQKSLAGYLEQKRALYPRFYFVSDPVLLEVLSQGSDPIAVQPHLQAVFDNVVATSFDKDAPRRIVELHSAEGEALELTSSVAAEGNIEDWLQRLTAEMCDSVLDVVRDAVADLPLSTHELQGFAEAQPSQIALLGIQIQWTDMVEEALAEAKTDKTAVVNCLADCDNILSELTRVTTGELSGLMRNRVETMITVQVHQRDVVEDLMRRKVRDVRDFDWQKQARFYWRDRDDQCIISCADMDFSYACEYLGCRERLVVTPLTDRCYITLTQALGMFLGGAPAGPAGTGKTETVKDLGRALALYVVVFNCSDQMDFRATGKIYKGLAQSGCWGCFDEFNRINLDVLSVVAQQVHSVLTALKERKTSFVFTDGSEIPLDPHVGMFITMNPGYAGRQELPENLKILFRGVAMMVPDRQIIIKVKLSSAGFQQAAPLSLKFHVLYRLCEQQLSKQPHYDFGLRNILSVLRTAGPAKRRNQSEDEALLLMRTLRDMNLSKLVAEDVPLFISLIGDLFPGMSPTKGFDEKVQEAVIRKVGEAGLQNLTSWVTKCMELHDTVLVRHGVMLVGPAGSGKSECCTMLKEALSEVDTAHKEVRMNPKAITASQMFGRLDPISNDWTDGVFAALWRKAMRSKSFNSWIVLDGPVDAIWIENLNTVLDDNKLLTLANGDRIPMAPHTRLMFEVENLNNASPATVSRAGIVFISDVTLAWKPLVASWVAKHRSVDTGSLQQLLESSIEAASAIFEEQKHNAMLQLPFVGCVQSCLSLLHALLSPANSSASNSTCYVERCVAVSVAWGVGGTLHEIGRAMLSERIVSTLGSNANPSSAGDGSRSECSLFDVCPSAKKYESWTSLLPHWQFPEQQQPSYCDLVVPTTESLRVTWLMRKQVLESNHAVLLIGKSGTAKTTIMDGFLASAEEELDYIVWRKFNLSSATTPLQYQRAIESWVDKKPGRKFGPPNGKKMIVFVDDCSMPQPNEWGDQETCEMARQLIEMKGIYNLDKPGELKAIEDLLWTSAMFEPAPGINDLPMRLKRHYAGFGVPLPSSSVICHIFGSMVEGFCKMNHVDGETTQALKQLPTATTDIWMKCQERLLPTPAKMHYVFNLRDVSRVFQGILRCQASVLDSTFKAVSVWAHECRRVLGDKLVDMADWDWLLDGIRESAQRNLGAAGAHGLSAIASNAKEDWWCAFMRDAEEPDGDEIPEDVDLDAPRIYEPMSSLDEIKKRMQELQERFNTEPAHRGKSLNLVLFDDAIRYACRIARVVGVERGHALLVGVGGSGKQSLARLGSYFGGCFTTQVRVTKSFTLNNMMDELRAMFRGAGVHGKGSVLLMTDNDLNDDSILDALSSVLSTGDVPGLFARDELEACLGELRTVAAKKKMPLGESQAEALSLFRSRVRANLHIVLTMSPVGEGFRRRALMFPALISGCTMVWFQPWPKEALEAVAQRLLLEDAANSETEVSIRANDEHKQSLISVCGAVQVQAMQAAEKMWLRVRRRAHFTPKSFLSYLTSYKELYGEKFTAYDTEKRKVSGGLDKLQSAAEDVKVMRVDLKEQEVVLTEARAQTGELLKNITESTQKAEVVKADVQAVANKLEKDAAIVASDKAQAERELEKAKPALEEAESALRSISPKDIQTLKQLRNPPDLIKRIFDGVIILKWGKLDKFQAVEYKGRLQPKDTYTTAVGMMSQMNFIEQLLNFEKESITEEQVELLAPYLEMEDFNFEAAKKSSGNVAGLCSWVKSMVTYYWCARDIAPKIVALRVAESKLAQANAMLAQKREELAEKEAEVSAMRAEFDAAMAKKAGIEDDADRTRRRLDAADALISGLSGERVRWTEQVTEFDGMQSRLVGDVLVSAAFLAYAGPFDSVGREFLISQGILEAARSSGIPLSLDFDPLSFLIDDATVGKWRLEGLPTDTLSTQNGVIVKRSNRWSLLIDPQGQGTRWLQSHEKEQDIITVHISSNKFRSNLEQCMALGRPLCVLGVDGDVDPMLDPVLEKQIVKAGKALVVLLADKECEYNNDFRMYMSSKLPNPSFSPELFAKSSVVNFAVTMKGLEDQLLGRVVQTEKAELEEQRMALVTELTENRLKINALQDDLLMRLSTAQGSLVEDDTLLQVLRTTQTTVKDVKDKVDTATQTQKAIDTAREEYRPVATRGSVLYSMVTDIASLNPMYETSLDQFLDMFDGAVEHAEKSTNTGSRVVNIVGTLTEEVFQQVSRGLFNEHKRVLGLTLSLKVDQSAGQCSSNEAALLLRLEGAPATTRTCPVQVIQQEAWARIQELCRNIREISGLCDGMAGLESEWKDFMSASAPERSRIPGVASTTIRPIVMLLIIRALRPERLTQAADQYVRVVLGDMFANSSALNLDAMLEQSVASKPLVFLLSPGADPTGQIESLARKLKREISAVSMGQGQEPLARRVVTSSAAAGGWALLQNGHLGLPFMREVVPLMSKMEKTHPNFRLWVTSEPHKDFPIDLLHCSMKITNEPPQGLRAGLQRSMNWISQDMLEAVGVDDWRPALYSLCFMHSIVQERRKFGPIGWCIPYEFNQGDLSASVSFVQRHMLTCELTRQQPSWSTVRYMVCEVQYGGRITDDWDRRLFNAFGEKWLTAKCAQSDFEFHRGYGVPAMTDISILRSAVQKIPNEDLPDVFGLHSNADLAVQLAGSRRLQDAFRDTQPRDGGSVSAQEIEKAVLDTANDLLSRLPPDFAQGIVSKNMKKLGGTRPLNIFLAQEVDLLQKVIGTVRSALHEVKLAIAGSAALGPALQEVMSALYEKRTPAAWTKISWPSPSLSLWFQGMIQRDEQLRNWVTRGRPAVFWLPGWFNPQGFLTAMRQEVTRRHQGWALDDVVLHTEVTRMMTWEEVKEAPSDGGVYVHGLYLVGASWDARHGKLTDSLPGQLITGMPVVMVSAVQTEGRPTEALVYHCPCYRHPARTDRNFIFTMNLRTDDPPQKWILRGVAAVCSKEE